MEAEYTILVETPATRVSRDRGRERAQLLHPFHSRQSGSRGRVSHADSKLNRGILRHDARFLVPECDRRLL